MEFIGRLTYLTNTLLCAVLVGYLTSYAITLGSYFTHMLRNDGVKELQESYAPFRAGSNTKALYGICFVLQIVVAAVSLALNHSARPLPAQVYALAILPIFMTVHVVTGFGRVEEKMVSGKELTRPEIALYTKHNLPLHLIYAALYLIGAAWLAAAFF